MKNETMNSNSESMFITELSVVAKTEVKTQDLRKHISFIFLMAMRGVRGFMSRVHRKRDVHSLDCMVCPKLSSANLEKPLLTNIILEHSLHAKNWKIH